MKYLTTAGTAGKWAVSSSLVLKLAQSGRIPGALRIGARWMIPDDAEKPADARTRAGKAEKTAKPDTFRFPGFEYRSLSAFDPPLNEEELTIKAVTEAVYACRFSEADKRMGDLPEKATDRYLRINALYTGCMIDIYQCNTARFLRRYGRLTAELEKDFPHKAEMAEYLHSLRATLGEDAYYSHAFHVRPDYEYHESFLPRLANLSAVSLTLVGGKPTPSELRAHELNCLFLKNSEAYADRLSLHLYLGISYGLLGETEKQKLHLREALRLAEKYEIYYNIVNYYYYMRKLFKPVMPEFSKEFRNRLEKLCSLFRKKYIRFLEAMSMNSIYKLITSTDYIFLQYAEQGITNKEIADRLHMSAGAVSKRYGEIYALLGVENKAALVELYEQLIDVSTLGK